MRTKRGELIEKDRRKIEQGGIGAQKKWQQWRKTWHDLRKHNIKKRSQLSKSARATGGGPPHPDKWGDEDELLSGLICDAVVHGDPNTAEPTLKKIRFDDVISEASNSGATLPLVPPIQPHVPVPNTPLVQDHNYIATPQPTKSAKRQFTKVRRLQESMNITKEYSELSRETLQVNKRILGILEERLALEKQSQQTQQGILITMTTILEKLEARVSATP